MKQLRSNFLQRLFDRIGHRFAVADRRLDDFQAMHRQSFFVGDITGVAARLDGVLAGADDRGANPFDGFAQDILRQLFQILAHVLAEHRPDVAIGFGIAVVNMLGNAAGKHQMLHLLETA